MSLEFEKPYYPITIHVTTNKTDRPFDLTKSVFYFPSKEEVEKKTTNRKGSQKKQKGGESPDEKEPSTTTSSQTPFYTDEKKYPISNVNSRKKFESYFDPELFEKTLGDIEDYGISEETRYENSNTNVMQMLETLFPTSLPSHLNINTTYATQVLKTAAPTATGTWLPTWLMNYFYDEDMTKYSYISIGGKKYTVAGVTWNNNVITHPNYMKFFKDLKGLEKEKPKEVQKITQEIQKITTEFINNRKNTSISSKQRIDAESRLNTMLRYNQRSNISNQNIYLTPMIDTINKIYNIQKSGNQSDIDEHIKLLYEINLLDNNSYDKFGQHIIPNEIQTAEFMGLLKMATTIETNKMILESINNPGKYAKEIYQEETPKYKFKLLKKRLDELGAYTKILNQIQRVISNVKSSNPHLQSLIKGFIEGDTNKTNQLFDLAKKIVEDRIDEITDLKLLNAGVVNTAASTFSKKDSKGKDTKTPPKYEIYIKLDLIDEIVDKKNVDRVNCRYRNNRLTTQYYNLRRTKKRRGGKKNQ